MDPLKGNQPETHTAQHSDLDVKPLRRRDVRMRQQAVERTNHQALVAQTPVWEKPIPIHSAQNPSMPQESTSIETQTFIPPVPQSKKSEVDRVTNPAGYHAIKQCLEVQGPVVGRKPLAKFFGISPLTSESSSWYKGAIGEIEVGERLESLNKNWLVLHSVPIGDRGSDIDHIVVGLSGVFTINTKRHINSNVWVGGRTVMINGTKQPYIRNSEFEADRVQKMLRTKLGWMPPVTAVLAIQAKTLNIKKAPEQVVVDDARWLVRRLKNRRRELSDEQYQQLAALVQNPDTWGIIFEDPTQMMADFAQLKKQVKSSQLTKLIWFGGATLLGLWVVPPVITGIIAGLF